MPDDERQPGPPARPRGPDGQWGPGGPSGPGGPIGAAMNAIPNLVPAPGPVGPGGGDRGDRGRLHEGHGQGRRRPQGQACGPDGLRPRQRTRAGRARRLSQRGVRPCG